MEHLPYPDGPSISPLEVPYYERYTYDRLGLKDFPTRQSLIDPENGGWVGLDDPTNMAAFLQAWLWFGLLESWLGESLDTREFVKHHNGSAQGPVLTAVSLSKRLETLTNRTHAMSEQEKFVERTRQKNVLKSLYLLLLLI
jgi:hypothetical protein